MISNSSSRCDAERPPLHRGVPDRLKRVLEQRQLIRSVLKFLGQASGGGREADPAYLATEGAALS